MQLTAKHKVATPVNWKQGDDVIIIPAVSNEEAQQKYPEGWKTLKPYLRVRQAAEVKAVLCSSLTPYQTGGLRRGPPGLI